MARIDLVSNDRFIQSIRHSAYRGTAMAVAELVDNAIQAKAGKVDIQILDAGNPHVSGVAVVVLDDGIGMNTGELQQALQFGGSSRYGSRDGLGRYGMGLPGSSVSQAKRVDVYTWRQPGAVLTTHLDVDEVVRR